MPPNLRSRNISPGTKRQRKPEPKYFSFTTNSENVASAAVSSYSGVKRKKDSDQIQNVQHSTASHSDYEYPETMCPVLSSYDKLLVDLRKSPVSSIQQTYASYDRIHIDVDQGTLDESRIKICQLDSFEDYGDLLSIKECAKSGLLMYFGTGAPIAGIKDPFYNEKVKTDRCIKSFQDIERQICIGTLGGFVKCNNVLYGLTVQHIFEEKTADGNRALLAEISKDNIDLKLSDIIHVGSVFGGVFDSYVVGLAEKAVDAAAFNIEQVSLDETQLTNLPIKSIDDLLPKGQPHKYYVVEKIGAQTGKTTGIIIEGRARTRLHGDNCGDMFLVAPLCNESSMVFAAKGDSGSLVTTSIMGQEYAIGMVQGWTSYRDIGEVTRCVDIKYCLEVLTRQYKGPSLELYKGSLRPFVGVHDRINLHV